MSELLQESVSDTVVKFQEERRLEKTRRYQIVLQTAAKSVVLGMVVCALGLLSTGIWDEVLGHCMIAVFFWSC